MIDFFGVRKLAPNVRGLSVAVVQMLPHEQLLLICKNCQEIEERITPQVMQALADEFNATGFIVHSKAIEIHGLCRQCATSVDADLSA